MFGGFRGGSGGQFSRGGNSFFDPNGFPQTTAPPTFNPATAFQNITPPPSTVTPPADNGSNGAINNINGGNNIGGEPVAAAAGSASRAAAKVGAGSNNLSEASTVTRSIFLPPSPITTITTTAKPLTTLATDGSTSPATQPPASVSATRKNVAPVGIIVGVLLGGISFTIATFFAVLWVRRRKMQRKKKVPEATPYCDITQSEVHAKGRFEPAGHSNYLPPYSPPASSSAAGSSSIYSSEKPLLTSTTAATSRTILQVANRESIPNEGGSRWSNSTLNTAFQPPRYATLFRIMSRPNTHHPSQDHLPLAPPLPRSPIPAIPKSPESDTLSYVTPTDQDKPLRW